MRTILFLLMTFRLFATQADPPGLPVRQPDTQIITSDEINAAGIINISDILTLVNKWNASTIDGFTWYISPNALTDYQHQNIIVMVDSQRVNINYFDNINFNLLPFSVNRISYVEIINSPVIINGEYAGAGLIHFHLKKPEHNLTSHILFANGNETGDPGPYKYTQFRSVNIDRINFLLSVDADYKSKNWALTGGYKQEENYDTDENIKYRLLTSVNDLEKAKTTSAFGKLFLNLPGTTLNLLSFFTTNRDYLFFRPFGNEIPVQKIIYFGGINGDINISRQIVMSYNFKVTDNRLADWQKISMDLRVVNLSANLETKFNTGNFIPSIGFGIEKYTAYTGINLTDNTILLRKIYLTFNYSAGNFYQTLNSLFTRDDREYSFKNSITSSYKISSRNSLHSVFSLSNSTLDEVVNYWTWFERNYSPSLTRDVNYEIKGAINKSSRFTADFTHIYNIDSLTIESGILFRREKGYIVRQNFQLKDNYFYSPVELYPDQVIQTAGAFTGIKQKLSDKFSYEINYYYQQTIGGDEFYKDIRQSIPRHRGTIIFNYKPLYTFGIWARINYFSPVRWLEFNYLSRQSGDKFNNEIKPGPLVDLSIQKWFGERLIRMNLVFRNILNQKEIYHPAGAQFNFRFYLQVDINLDNLPE